jgi:hypothetical protein
MEMVNRAKGSFYGVKYQAGLLPEKEKRWRN